VTITLRPYQQAALDDIRQAYRDGFRAPLLVSPTGSGKTVMFSAITHGAQAKGKRVLILCHRVELLEQIERALRSFSIVPGMIAANRAESPRALVQVASVFTLARRLERVAPPDLIIVDEAHHAIGNSTWGAVLKRFSQALVLGVTATPIRLSSRESLADTFDTLIFGPTVQELIDLGALSPVTIYAPPGPDLSNVHSRMGDYIQSELSAVMTERKVVGDAVDHYRRLAPGRPAVAFCVSVEHAKHMAHTFREGGFTSVNIDGSLDASIRSNIVRDFTAGRINVLTSCDLISEGFDVPAIEVGLLLRPTQSLGLFLQQCGRVLRPHPGKSRALILDHAGNIYRHGLPQQDRTWSLRAGGIAGAPCGNVSPTGAIRICRRCFSAAAGTRRECPECGEPFEVKARTVDTAGGELKPVDETLSNPRPKRQLNPASSLEALTALGEMRGYKDPAGWARHVFEARQKKKQTEVIL
jgi:DNA repair protein RadD